MQIYPNFMAIDTPHSIEIQKFISKFIEIMQIYANFMAIDTPRSIEIQSKLSKIMLKIHLCKLMPIYANLCQFHRN